MEETPQRTVFERPPEETPSSERRGWLRRAPILVAVLLVGALVGVALALLLSVRPPGDDSAEAGFARDMMVHHAQAVEMAEILRDNTESEEMRTLAADVALTQQAQIGQMQGWLAVWDLPPTGSEPAMSWMGHPTEGRMPGMASPEEIRELSEASPEEVDVRFLQLMIPHHQAALSMTEAVLERTDREEVERLAGAIAASQEAEIEAMQDLLRSRGAPVEGETPTPDGDSHGDHEHQG
ncbi:MAG: DUF305 domain-containing protein [Actinomycetota bacterium]|nr:DUF305 domain-containing protein [Actinomycetota bacterium]